MTMPTDTPLTIKIAYQPSRLTGILSVDSVTENSIWDRLEQSTIAMGVDYAVTPSSIELPWPGALTLIRELSPLQRSLGFRFKPADDSSAQRLQSFVADYKKVQAARDSLVLVLSEDEVTARLQQSGFTKRVLTKFQMRDLRKLLSLPNGANFSVPGAGKTTVTLALHVLTSQPGQHILVVGPKSAFPAWSDVVSECIATGAPNDNDEAFTVLSGSADAVQQTLLSGKRRFVMNYEMLIQMPEVISTYLARQPVHLVLDEAHRMKAGIRSQRGAYLLNAAPLPIRRDILTGTPMPQHAADLQSQLDFLWPGAGLGMQISQGQTPRDVLGNLFVRTTKADLGLPKPKRHFVRVKMAPGQTALYAIIKDESLRQFSRLRTDNRIDIIGAKKSVMRLLQLSSNPLLALRSITDDMVAINSGIVDAVIAEGPSTKMTAVADLARELAKQGRKSVIWTIFTDNILQMESILADLNPVSLYGAVPSGSRDDPGTREGRLKRFHEDAACMVMLANPAAAGEGISLHHVCHDAIYLDRSYVSTHYLQSIDRIHRLGLPPDTETNIHIFQTMTPQGLGSVDHSVSRRLSTKLRALQALLDDTDLHEIALDEESADDPVDYEVDPADVVDLIEQLEGKATYIDDDAE